MKCIIFFFILFLSNAVLSKDWPCIQLSKLPVKIEGCEGEACGVLRYDRIVKEVDLYSDISSSVSKKIKSCSKITYFNMFYILKKPSKVEFVQPILDAGVNVGDTALITKNIGEGYVEVCLNDKLHHIAVSMPEEKIISKDTVGKLLNHSESDSWVQMKFVNGEKGFVKHKTGDWYQGQYTYDPGAHCENARFPDPKSETYPHGCPEIAEVCNNGKIKVLVPPSCEPLECEL